MYQFMSSICYFNTHRFEKSSSTFTTAAQEFKWLNFSSSLTNEKSLCGPVNFITTDLL